MKALLIIVRGGAGGCCSAHSDIPPASPHNAQQTWMEVKDRSAT